MQPVEGTFDLILKWTLLKPSFTVSLMTYHRKKGHGEKQGSWSLTLNRPIRIKTAPQVPCQILLQARQRKRKLTHQSQVRLQEVGHRKGAWPCYRGQGCKGSRSSMWKMSWNCLNGLLLLFTGKFIHLRIFIVALSFKINLSLKNIF